jgi:peptide/nickel transport system permease protein
LDALRENYGLGQPLHVQYWKWISGVVVGDFGLSFQWNRPVSELLWDRLALTVILSATTIVFVWIVAFPVGVYSALNHYSFGDYFFTFLGFLGRAIPNFMLALFIMYFAFELFGVSTWGLFSQEYADAPWSLAKFLDLLQHLVVPVIVLGTAGTAGTIRVMRANLLDELSKQYVITARAKGLSRLKVVWKYPIRIALNPFISTVGWILPQLISGAAIVSVVLNLPTTGPLFLNALRTQDMYLAGSFLMMLSTLTVIGTLISDLLLAWVDPRIRYR